MTVPALVKILCVFGAMLLLIRLRAALGLVLILGGVAVSAWAGHGPAAIAIQLAGALRSSSLWLLLLITMVIVELGRFVAAEHNAAAIMQAARRWGGRHGRAASLMTIPAVLGLIPVPGGALFSAPFVHRLTGDAEQTAEWKATTNYWFRHVWEYWWPLYPVTILTLSIFDLPTWQYIFVQFPLTFATIGAGYFWLVRPHLETLKDAEPPPAETPRRVWLVFASLGLVLCCALLLPRPLQHFAPQLGGQSAKLIAILIGLAVALGLVAFAEKPGQRPVPFRGLFKRKTLNILFSLAGVLIFKHMMEQSGLLPEAAEDLARSGISPWLIITALPFIAGLVTGIALGFAGTAFPLVAGLVADPAVNLPLLSTIVLCFGAGYAGMMLSPVHLCLILTRDYFSAAFGGTYRHLVPCVLTVFAAVVVLHFALRTAGF